MLCLTLTNAKVCEKIVRLGRRLLAVVSFIVNTMNYERSNKMIYTQEVENMCPVAQGVHHGAAPVPTEA